MQQLQPGAAQCLVLESKDGTEHGCWHDCMELGTTARAGRRTEKPPQEAVVVIHEHQKQGERKGRAEEWGNPLSFFPDVLWGRGDGRAPDP